MDSDVGTSRRDLLIRAGTLGAVGAVGTFAGGCRGAAPTGALALSPEREARIDDLLADLSDQRASAEPISAAQRRAWRERCGRVLAERGIDAFLCEGGATMSWLSGVGWGQSERLFALVLLADGAFFWLVPAFEEGKARLQIDAADGPGGDVVTWDEHEYPYAPLAAELERRRAHRVAFEPRFRYVFAARFAAEIGNGRIAPLDGSEIVIALRARKDAHELALLRRANELTQRAITAVAPLLKPGMTGREIGALMDRAHRKLGFERPWNLSLLGAAAALPHGDADAHKLGPGDVVLIDTGGSFHGYQSDITRTWVFGAAPSLEIVRAWNAVRDAQQRAFDALKPGLECAAIDAIARERIDAAGYGPGYRTFTHRLGHGIGVEGHEDPYFDGGNRVRLEAGMTLSNEPGIYLPGKFGVRIEDIVAITADGAEHFGAWQTSATSPA